MKRFLAHLAAIAALSATCPGHAAGAAPVAPPAQAQAASQGLDYEYLGVLQVDGRVREILVSRNGREGAITAGMLLQDRYRVEALLADRLELRDLTDGRRFAMRYDAMRRRPASSPPVAGDATPAPFPLAPAVRPTRPPAAPGAEAPAGAAEQPREGAPGRTRASRLVESARQAVEEEAKREMKEVMGIAMPGDRGAPSSLHEVMPIVQPKSRQMILAPPPQGAAPGLPAR